MLSLARREIDPIAPVLRELEPGADTSQMGSWGILYLICGALAGQSLDWKATIFENIPAGHTAFQQWLSGKPSEMDLAFGFRDLILTWAQDSAGLAVARGRLRDSERGRGAPLSDKGRQHFLDYFRLAIVLNSLTGVEMDQVTPIKRWAEEHDQGWATLFFAAGLLLSSEGGFPWPSIGAGLKMASHTAKDQVKMLLDQFQPRHR